MKYNKWLIALLGAGAMLTSCVDDFDTNAYVVQKPGDKADYEYLNDYAPLKEYIDRSAHPNFKASAALTASEFNKKGTIYTLALSNFDEVVAGNAMKMASVVNGKGEMDFGTVQSFVAAAEDAGLTVYGHTLAWHSQQPIDWLKKLLADKPMPKPDGPTVDVEVPIYEVDYTTTTYSFWNELSSSKGATITNGENGLVVTNPSAADQNYYVQYHIGDNLPITEGKDYVLKIEMKGSDAGSLNWGVGPWSGRAEGKFDFSTDWEVFSKKFTAVADAGHIMAQTGLFAGTLEIRKVQICEIQQQTAGPEMIDVEVTDYEIDYSTSPYTFWNELSSSKGATIGINNGCLEIVNPEASDQNYYVQYHIGDGLSLEQGKDYYLVVECKGTDAGSLSLGVGPWSGRAETKVDFTTEWDTYKKKFTAVAADGHIMAQSGLFVGTLQIKSVKIMHIEQQAAPTIDEVEDYKIDYTTSPYTFWSELSSSKGATIGINNGCLEIVNPEPADQNYYVQYHIGDGLSLEQGKEYYLIIEAKGSSEGTLNLGVGPWSGRAETKIDFGTEWETYKKKFTAVAADGHIMAQSGLFAGTLQIKSVTIMHEEEKSSGAGVEVEKVIVENKPTIVVTTQDMAANPWDSQFWIVTNDAFNDGAEYEFSVDVRADAKAQSGSQVHGDPGAYVSSSAVGTINFDTEWNTYKSTGTLSGAGHSIAFNLNDYAKANKYYYRNFVLKINGKNAINNGDLKTDDVSSFVVKEYPAGNPTAAVIQPSISYTVIVNSNTIPLTPEEKKDTLVYAMNKWVRGMMDATEGKVKAWDLINEAVSGGGNVGGYYDLQHTDGYAPGGTWDVGGDAFYWQDYFGNEEYGVIVEKAAREAYAAQEGANPADLKLFINDYNLESTWDNNKKLESLIYWIGVWEQGGAKIDGIGTQMHISYIRDAEQQENQKKHITRMFELMAKTGKLVRISELDMGLVDKQFGEAITLDKVTFADEQAMAEYYKWIIKEYYRVIPAAQQYGICQWCITDSEEGSGWRSNEPVGLWYLDYSRKPAYAGWADGLGDK